MWMQVPCDTGRDAGQGCSNEQEAGGGEAHFAWFGDIGWRNSGAVACVGGYDYLRRNGQGVASLIYIYQSSISKARWSDENKEW